MKETFTVRIAVAIASSLDWEAFGSSYSNPDRVAMNAIKELNSVLDDEAPRTVVWVECEIPVPRAPIRRGHVMTTAERAAVAALEADRCEAHGLYKCVECAERG